MRWIGAAQSQAQVDRCTVGSTTVGHTFKLTINDKVLTYTAVTGDTVDTIAAGLVALAQASPDGEFSELVWAAVGSSGYLTATGPADGKPFTLSVGGGTGTFSRTTLTSPKSPHDLGDALNYSGSALPSGGDMLVFEATDVSALYNLAALSGIDLTVIRRATFTGSIGLPDISDAGYREYRTTRLELDTTSVVWEQPASDGAGQCRLKIAATGGAATALTVAGTGAGAQVGQEALDVIGLAGASVVDVTGGSVALAPDTSGVNVVATLRGVDSTISAGVGVTIATADLYNCQSRLLCGTTTLKVNGGGRCEVGGSATGSAVFADGGARLLWTSTGTIGTAPEVAGGATIDFSQAPGPVTVSGTAKRHAGGNWLDPAGRCGSYTIQHVRTTLDSGRFDPGAHKTTAVS